MRVAPLSLSLSFFLFYPSFCFVFEKRRRRTISFSLFAFPTAFSFLWRSPALLQRFDSIAAATATTGCLHAKRWVRGRARKEGDMEFDDNAHSDKLICCYI